ncbi:hypothetical protein JG688_00016062 [Phytophthora aleatoria]|uniref:Uncharacterized protein n=1 Tax=Phytophthora aleatoria TaxID=2496075 RepID=A0A8J5IJ99_9STRA|nr:hypothetical protein JG688_00016062 [Phytophthora aleatoria]
MDSSDSDSSSSDEEELAVLVLLSRSGSQCRSDRFNFEQPTSAAVWKPKFRFVKDDIIGLVMHFQLPDPFPTRSAIKSPPWKFCAFSSIGWHIQPVSKT